MMMAVVVAAEEDSTMDMVMVCCLVFQVEALVKLYEHNNTVDCIFK